MAEQPAEARQAARALWAGGDYSVVAAHISPASAEAIESAAVAAGDRVLDVACGTGNSALPAAEAGAEVTALDITPELLAIAQERAKQQGLEIDFVEGDAQGLPFDDESFDVVISVFGCMFAPDHRATAAELTRVLRPGGRLAVAAWTPQGAMGRMFITTAGRMPDPPEDFEPPVLWGDEEHVREIFGPTGTEVDVERPTVRLQFDSLESAMREAEEAVPPIVAARAFLEAEGRWQPLRDDLVALYREMNDSDSDELSYDAEYLLTKGRKPG